ncbi:MAG: DUF418 domain-containing protein [Parasphingorhabdus sp.]
MKSITIDTAPTKSGERYVIMDVLRGFALFGVLVMNVSDFGSEGILATEEQLAALPNADIDAGVLMGLKILVTDKANTLFALLFGLGFWVQMERLEARGAPFRSIYLRRSGILLVIGALHWVLFAFDILHIYAVVAFILLFCRNLSDRMLLIIGLILFLFAAPVTQLLLGATGILDAGLSIAFAEDAILRRQEVALSGSFSEWIAVMTHWQIYLFFVGGLIFGWLLYVIGRFFIGAWLARQGWIQNAPIYLPKFKKYLAPLLFSGLVLEVLAQILKAQPDGAWFGLAELLAMFLHAFATPLIAAGYICALVAIFHGSSYSWVVKPFAQVGQMALTNYLCQTIIILLIFTNIGPGLGLAGNTGQGALVIISVIAFAAQVILSHFWMKNFSYGPAEWVWRSLTYGTIPKFRRLPAEA